MNRRGCLILFVTLALIVATAGVVWRFKASQRLGSPGVKVQVVAGGRQEVFLPEKVLDYKSQKSEMPPEVLEMLPRDTTYGLRVYEAADGFAVQLYVVLMGADRSSIHKPQICLPSRGLTIDRTEVVNVPVTQPLPYDLPVVKLTLGNIPAAGRQTPLHGLFVYWFVADGELSADESGLQRMWAGAWHLLRTGELQRWAYVGCFTVCEPGAEDKTFERVREIIAAVVPQFQLGKK